MADPWIGFWQVVEAVDAEDDGDEIVPNQVLHTTMSLRSAGFSVYTARHFVEIRAQAGRRPPKEFPPTEAEAQSWYESVSVSYGTCTWRQTDRGWYVEHAPDGRTGGAVDLDAERDAQLDGDRASIGGEEWRRLSGAGITPLAGAWASPPSASERWLYLVTAGHYAVVREQLTSDVREIERLRCNAGARLESRRSFDHWPFVTTSGVGLMDSRKHETFRITEVLGDAFLAGFASDGVAAARWDRLQ